MAELSISTLGPLRMTLGGEPIDRFRTDKACALLVYLAIEVERPHRREALAGLLWPEYPEANARHTLSQTLTNLRRLLGDRNRHVPYLDTTRATVALSAEHQPWVDAREFDTLVSAGRVGHRSLDRGDGPDGPLTAGDADELERLVQAVTLYQGGFMSGFSLGDAPAFEEWQLLHRERLHRQMTEALSCLVAAYLASGAYDAALRYAWRWVELDPWQEPAQRQLIRLLALTGQRSAALRQGEICARILAQEIGVAPDAATHALVEAVRAGRLVDLSPSARSLPPTHGPTRASTQSPARAPGNRDVPIPLMPLVGREAELAELSARLRDPAVRLLTLVGPGGIGKTRLGLELARIHAQAFPDGVYVVSLVAATSWEACVTAIAQAVGLVPSARAAIVEQQLIDFLRGRTMLLVLDNFEHLVADAPRLVDLMASAAQVRVVTTSRARLGVLGEHTYPVGRLAAPEGAVQKPLPEPALAALAEVAAVKLFIQSARRVAHDFALSATNAAAVAEICRLVEGMPLALLLAAAWTPVLTPDRILERLLAGTDAVSDRPTGDLPTGDRLLGDRPLDFLHARWPEMPARHRSLRAVFDHTWRLLGTRARMLLQALSVFRGGFGSEAAFFVCGAALSEIRRLADQSLLVCAAENRYGMQELLRQYAAERLAQAPVAERAVRDRHATYYVGVLQRWFEAAKGPLQVAALAEMDGEIDNAQVAWDYTLDQGDIARLAQAVDGLMLAYLRRVRRQEAQRVCRRALDCIEGRCSPLAVDPAVRRRFVATLLIWQSEVSRGEEAMAAVDRALALLSVAGETGKEVRVALGRALRRKARLLSDTDRGRALALYEESLACLRAAGDAWEEARTLQALANLSNLLGDLDAARRHGEKLLTIARAHGDARALAWALQSLGANAMYRGETQTAVRMAEESLAVLRELDDPLEVAWGLQTLATRQLLMLRIELATPLFDEAIAILDHYGVVAPYARGVKAWGLMHTAGDYEQARRLARRALEEARADGDRRLIAWSEHVIGCLALVNGDVDGAVTSLAQAAAVFRELGEPTYLGLVLSCLGHAYRAAGDCDRARSCFVEVLQGSEQIWVRSALAWALAGMAVLYAEAGRAVRALTLLTVLEGCCPIVPGSRWFADVAGPVYHAAMNGLTPEQIAEARQQALLSELGAEAQRILSELEDGIER